MSDWADEEVEKIIVRFCRDFEPDEKRTKLLRGIGAYFATALRAERAKSQAMREAGDVMATELQLAGSAYHDSHKRYHTQEYEFCKIACCEDNRKAIAAWRKAVKET